MSYLKSFFIFTFILALIFSFGTISAQENTHCVANRDAILKKYSPVFIQEIGHEPLNDLMTRFDFDGNFNGADNAENAKSGRFAFPATIYAEVLAETEDAYILLYSVYHIRDYNTKIQQMFFDSVHHDNDLEGVMVLLSKKTQKIIAMETWYHSVFLQFSPHLNVSTEYVMDGRLNFEDELHPVIYVQDMGHGVRAFQKVDEPRMLVKKHQIYRLAKGPGEKASDLAQEQGLFVTYQMESFDDFFKRAFGPFHEDVPGHPEAMFAGATDFKVGGKKMGRFISGPFKGDEKWARPKPPWSWKSKFDNLPVGTWFFHPAYVFKRRFGLDISQKYLCHYGLQKLFPNQDSNHLVAWMAESPPRRIKRKPYLQMSVFELTAEYSFNFSMDVVQSLFIQYAN